MNRYIVQFFSNSQSKWIDYSAITFNSKTHEFATEGEAKAYLAKVQREHPRDQLRVTEVGA